MFREGSKKTCPTASQLLVAYRRQLERVRRQCNGQRITRSNPVSKPKSLADMMELYITNIPQQESDVRNRVVHHARWLVRWLLGKDVEQDLFNRFEMSNTCLTHSYQTARDSYLMFVETNHYEVYNSSAFLNASEKMREIDQSQYYGDNLRQVAMSICS